MKLTCLCGMSIEVENVLQDRDTTPCGALPQLDQFKADHQPCLDRWREKAIFVPMYTVHCDSAGKTVRVTPSVFDGIKLDEQRCQVFDFMLSTLKQAYYELLRMPMDSERIRLQGTLSRLRDAIADAEGRDAEAVQNEYEAKASDPFARFREALNDGKRVWVDPGDGILHKCERPSDIGGRRDYFVESVDIPTQPTQEWLDRHGVELTGECRRPERQKDSRWAGAQNDNPWLCSWTNEIPAVGDYNGRRWILRKKVDTSAFNVAPQGTDVGFDAWIDSLSSDTLRNALNSDAASRSIVRSLWKDATR